MPTKTAGRKKASGDKVNALQKRVTAVGGAGCGDRLRAPLPRGEMVSKIWEYIRSHQTLQNPEDRRENRGR